MAIDIWFDGGSLNNQSATNRKGYGSFKTFFNGKPVTMTIDRGTKTEKKVDQCRLEFGTATNNESEWKTFLVALMYALQVQVESGAKLEFVFHGDSQNVLGPFLDNNKVKAANLKPLYEKALGYVETLGPKFVKESGDKVKEVLGH